MFKDNYIKIFDKFVDIIDWSILQKSTVMLNTNYKTSKLFTKDHLKLMIYYHLAELVSLRDLSDSSSYNSGLKESLKDVSLGTLSHQNNNRNFGVFVPVMNAVIKLGLDTLSDDKRIQKYGCVEIIDSTTMSMILTYFSWAKFRSTKAGVKMHTRFNLSKQMPDLVIVSNAEEHDSTVMESLMKDEGSIYIFDKAYVDYEKFDNLTSDNKSFITRLKDNAVTTIEDELKVTYSDPNLLDKGIEVLSDKLAYLGSLYTYRTKKPYRIIKIKDSNDKELTFVTNILNFSSEEIAWLYKKRWDIELFFKWIKQHLKIKNFIGHSYNAVMIQLITGIITYVLLKLIAEEAHTLAYGLLKIKRK